MTEDRLKYLTDSGIIVHGSPTPGYYTLEIPSPIPNVLQVFYYKKALPEQARFSCSVSKDESLLIMTLKDAVE